MYFNAAYTNVEMAVTTCVISIFSTIIIIELQKDLKMKEGLYDVLFEHEVCVIHTCTYVVSQFSLSWLPAGYAG